MVTSAANAIDLLLRVVSHIESTADPILATNFAKLLTLTLIDPVEERGATALAAADPLLAAIKRLADTYPSQPILRETWAEAALHLTDYLAASDLPTARRLHAEMKALADAHSGEPVLRNAWIAGAISPEHSTWSLQPRRGEAIAR